MRRISILPVVLMLAGCVPATAIPASVPATSTPFQPVPATPECPDWVQTDAGYACFGTATRIPVPRYVTVLMGTDGRPDKPGYGVRTDIFLILVADVPPSGPVSLTVVAVPRDLFLQVPCEPGYPVGEMPRNRVNAAWYRGGFGCVRETVRLNFGLEVNEPLALVDMADMAALVDSLGGLVLTPEQDYADACNDQPIFWAEGTAYRMSGAEVLCYIRGRKAYGGDLDRGRRAIEVVKTAAVQWPAAILYDPTRALDLYVAITNAGLVRTDATLADVVRVAALLPRALDMDMRSARLSVPDVDFASDPLYGSILIPLLDLKAWSACVLNGTEPAFCADSARLPG